MKMSAFHLMTSRHKYRSVLVTHLKDIRKDRMMFVDLCH